MFSHRKRTGEHLVKPPEGETRVPENQECVCKPTELLTINHSEGSSRGWKLCGCHISKCQQLGNGPEVEMERDASEWRWTS